MEAVATAAALLAVWAIADGVGLLPSCFAELESALTELCSAAVSFGKSLLALLTTALASFSTCVRADFKALVPLLNTPVVGTAWIELLRLATAEQ